MEIHYKPSAKLKTNFQQIFQNPEYVELLLEFIKSDVLEFERENDKAFEIAQNALDCPQTEEPNSKRQKQNTPEDLNPQKEPEMRKESISNHELQKKPPFPSDFYEKKTNKRVFWTKEEDVCLMNAWNAAKVKNDWVYVKSVMKQQLPSLNRNTDQIRKRCIILQNNLAKTQ